jgi:hypothetical protein
MRLERLKHVKTELGDRDGVCLLLSNIIHICLLDLSGHGNLS